MEEGSNPDHPDHLGQTHLFSAVKRGSMMIVDMLIQSGLVDVNRQDTDGRSPIFFAVMAENREIIRSLLQAQAIIEVSNKWGHTPESLARKRGFYGMFRYLTTRYA